MKKLLTLLFILFSLCYPFVVYWGLQQYDAKVLLPILLVLLAMRWLVMDSHSERKIVVATILGVGVIIFIGGNQLGLKFYPVMMNLGFFLSYLQAAYFLQ